MSVVADPIALIRQGHPDEAPVAYACGACGHVVGDSHGTAAELARVHCGPWPCRRCGADHERYQQPLCYPCWSAQLADGDAAREAERFAKAEKIAGKDYDGPVFCPSSSWNDGFHRDLSDLLEHFGDEGDDPPGYVWACVIDHPSIDAEAIIESALEDTREDLSRSELERVAELELFVRRWNEAQTAEIWYPDYKLAVVL